MERCFKAGVDSSAEFSTLGQARAARLPSRRFCGHCRPIGSSCLFHRNIAPPRRARVVAIPAFAGFWFLNMARPGRARRVAILGDGSLTQRRKAAQKSAKAEGEAEQAGMAVSLWGRIGELGGRPETLEMTEFSLPKGTAPYSIGIDSEGTHWITDTLAGLSICIKTTRGNCVGRYMGRQCDLTRRSPEAPAPRVSEGAGEPKRPGSSPKRGGAEGCQICG